MKPISQGIGLRVPVSAVPRLPPVLNAEAVDRPPRA
jgi:hypothetical protein